MFIAPWYHFARAAFHALPHCGSPRGAGGRGAILDGRAAVMSAGDVVAADEVVRGAVEVPVGVEVVERDVGAAARHERIEVAALEEQRRRRAGLVAVVLADDAGL